MNLSRATILLLCTVVATITSIGMSTFSLFLPPIEREFGLSRAMATLPYMVAMLGWAAGALTFGKLADDHGSRNRKGCQEPFLSLLLKHNPALCSSWWPNTHH